MPNGAAQDLHPALYRAYGFALTAFMLPYKAHFRHNRIITRAPDLDPERPKHMACQDVRGQRMHEPLETSPKPGLHFHENAITVKHMLLHYPAAIRRQFQSTFPRSLNL